MSFFPCCSELSLEHSDFHFIQFVCDYTSIFSLNTDIDTKTTSNSGENFWDICVKMKNEKTPRFL